MSWFDTIVDGASSFAGSAADTVSSTASSVAHGASDLASSGYHYVADEASKATASPTAALNAFAHYADGLSPVPEDAAKGASTLNHLVNKGVDWLEDGAHKNNVQGAKAVEGIPVLSQLAQASGWLGEQTTGVLGGTVRAVSGMGEGLVNMAAHPMQTAVGLGTLGYHLAGATVDNFAASYDTLTGDEDAAMKRLEESEHVKYNTAVGKAFIKPMADQWNQGRYGDAAGQASVQLAAILAGVGEGEAAEAGNAAKTAETADTANAAKAADGAESANAAKATHPYDPANTLGSKGRPFDPTEIPPPGERPNWPPNGGAAAPWEVDNLPPGTKLDRFGGPGGTFFSPDGTPLPQRAVPPLQASRLEYFYEVGPDGLAVEKSPIAPAFNEPGGGVQYQAPIRKAVHPPQVDFTPRMENLTHEGGLVELQRNEITELIGDDADAVRRIAEIHE